MVVMLLIALLGRIEANLRIILWEKKFLSFRRRFSNRRQSVASAKPILPQAGRYGLGGEKTAEGPLSTQSFPLFSSHSF